MGNETYHNYSSCSADDCKQTDKNVCHNMMKFIELVVDISLKTDKLKQSELPKHKQQIKLKEFNNSDQEYKAY